MPAKSKKQYQFMKAVAENKKFADKVGVSQSVGKEFTKVKKYDKGGKVIRPEDEKKRIKDLAKKERMKKILTEDMKTFGPKEESKPVKKKAGGMLKKPDNPGLKKLPTEVRNKMGYMKKGGKIGMGMTKNNYKKGGSVKCKRDGICVRGKTKGRMV